MKKSIAIIGEGETEWFYFESLRVKCRYHFKVAPDFPQHSDIGHMVKLVVTYVNREYDYVICLVDMDRLFRVPKEMELYQKTKRKYSKNNKGSKVMFIETNPCIEFWFLLHFLPELSKRNYRTYEELLPELQKYMPGYDKTKRYFERTNLYCYLTENGDLQRAIKNADYVCELSEKNPEDAMAYSEVQKLFEILNGMKW
jgi:hypothetical protein